MYVCMWKRMGKWLKNDFGKAAVISEKITYHNIMFDSKIIPKDSWNEILN